MKKVLVTGANGFVGRHLLKELAENDIEVVGVGGHMGATGQPEHVTEYLVLDLNDAEAVKRIEFKDIDGVIHLAGLAAVAPSFEDPMLYINTNIGLEVNLFEAALSQKKTPKFLIISSAMLYDPKAPLPLTEQSAASPASPYAVSKIGQEQMALHYNLRGFECVIARPFNHIGPGQSPGFLLPDIAQQIVEFEKGNRSEVLVGNLDSKRDYTDVRDIVRAYRLLLDKGVSGETYNICSGTAISGRDMVAGLRKASGSEAPLKEDPEKMRPADNPVLYGDSSKIKQTTGWQPEIPLETTLADVIEDWRGRV